MNNHTQPSKQVLWYLQNKKPQQCTQSMHVDVAVIGGGIAGLSAAQAFASRNKKVALFEQHFCGSGATGKGSGFVTPNSELSLSDFSYQTNNEKSQELWKFINNGLEKIRTNILNYNFDCQYTSQGGLFVANCNRTLKNIAEEHKKISMLGYESQLFGKKELSSILGSQLYFGGMTYDNSFGINTYEYCKSLQQYLEQNGVSIFEETPVTQINDHTLTTPHATVTADYIIVCVDKFLPQLGVMDDQIYHAQNFILVSEQLSEDQINMIFPQRPYMVWDSQLIYNYFRLSKDNRLVLGGGDIFSIYAKEESHNYQGGYTKIMNYFQKMFPKTNIKFEYQWPGLFGISKDLSPIATSDSKYPHIYYIAASAGLPIATALAMYSAEHMLDGKKDMDAYFRPKRRYFVDGILQKILGKKISFAVNNLLIQKTLGCFK